jgi:hypothetical protein
VDIEQIGHPLTKPADGIMLAIGMQASIEQRTPFRVLDSALLVVGPDTLQ